MIPFKELTEFDFQLLQKVSECQPVKLGDLSKLLPTHKAIKVRVELLSKPDQQEVSSTVGVVKWLPISNTSYLLNSDVGIKLTPLGVKALEDYQLQRKKEHAAKIIEYVWKFAPIIISLIALMKSFLPELKIIWQMLQQAR